MTFFDAVALQPGWVRIWVVYLTIVIVPTGFILLLNRRTRPDGLAIIAANAAVIVTVGWMFDRMGYVRLFGLPHLVFWGPLIVFLWRRLRQDPPAAPYRQLLYVFILSVAASLAFDTADVIRYALGERAPIP